MLKVVCKALGYKVFPWQHHSASSVINSKVGQYQVAGGGVCSDICT